MSSTVLPGLAISTITNNSSAERYYDSSIFSLLLLNSSIFLYYNEGVPESCLTCLSPNVPVLVASWCELSVVGLPVPDSKASPIVLPIVDIPTSHKALL